MTQRVRDLGEFALIDRALAVLPEPVRGSSTVHGAGDDCAWWHTTGDRTIATTDAMVEGVHFRLDWTDWRSLGHKLLAVNLSDLASMGASPGIALVTLALTGKELVSDIEDLYAGMGELAQTYGVIVAGGDVVRTAGPIVLSLTALGDVGPDETIMQRSAAAPGDIVLVSGTLGASAAGLQLLQRPQPQSTTAPLLISAHLRPQPRLSLGLALPEFGVRCCMDLSDGLAGDLPKILAASKVGARIDLDALPVLPAVRALFPDTWQQLAIHGGEDYELLFTAPREHVGALTDAAKSVGASVTAIGVITDGPELIWTAGDAPVDVTATAWDHFGHES